jgi:hypothetical protein
MKIIDEKGKLFGIINIIDLCMLLVVLVLAIGGVLYFSKERTKTTVETKDFYLTILCEQHREEVMDAIVVGDRLYYGNQFINAEITDVWSEPAIMDVFLPDGTIVSGQHPLLKDIYVKLRIIGDPLDPNDPMIYLGSTHATVGKLVTLKTTRVEIPAKIIKIEE